MTENIEKILFVLHQQGFTLWQGDPTFPQGESYWIEKNTVFPYDNEAIRFTYWGYTAPMPQIGDLLAQFDPVVYSTEKLAESKAQAEAKIDQCAAEIQSMLGTPNEVYTYQQKQAEIALWDSGERTVDAYGKSKAEAVLIDQADPPTIGTIGTVIEGYRQAAALVGPVDDKRDAIRVRYKQLVREAADAAEIATLEAEAKAKFDTLASAIAKTLQEH